MNNVVDASALLAVSFNESGSEVVENILKGAYVSAINFSEVLAKVAERTSDLTVAGAYFKGLGIKVIAFDEAQTYATAALRAKTKSKGLGVADRACLALALSLEAEVYTADKLWAELNIGAKIRLIR